MNIFSNFTIALMAVSLVSCEGSFGEGSFSLGVTVEKPVTKAASDFDEILGTASVDIYYADFSGLVRSYSYSDIPQTVWLPVSDYRVDVTAGEATSANPETASWDSKSYHGSSNFGIVAGQNTSVQVRASVDNAISRVFFDQSIDENLLDGYKLSIGVQGNDLVYDSSRNGDEGYFIVRGMEDPSFDWKFEGTTSLGEDISKSGSISGIAPGNRYSMTMKYSLNSGQLTLDLAVDDSTRIVDGTIVFEPSFSGVISSQPYEIWAGHAVLHASVDENEYNDPSYISFEFSRNGIDWSSVPAERFSAGEYRGVAKGLAPSTDYICRLAVSGVPIGPEMKIHTSDAPAVPNGSFEESSTSASGRYKEFCASGADPWWGSGNGSKGISGSADMGFVICRPDTDNKVDGKQSACMETKWALVKLAAGNMFSGYFGGLEGIKGGKVYFGRPFTGRPTALKVWLKYSSGKIDHVDGKPSGETIVKGETYDTGRVQVALGVWDPAKYGGTKDCPILVNTTKSSTFVDYATDSSTIAFGDLQLQANASNSYNSWAEYIIPIEYRDEVTMPTHIVISCVSSKYGDYFTGCSSSRLWVDMMELIYE